MKDAIAVREAAIREAAALGGAQAAQFCAAFLHTAAPDDLLAFPPETLTRLAMAARAAGEGRKPGEALVKAFTPDPSVHGFSLDGVILIALNDDKPFLFDSVLNEANSEGAVVSAAFHPVWMTQRGGQTVKESAILVALAGRRSADWIRALETRTRRVLADVGAAVADWRAMLTRLVESAEELKRRPPPVEPSELGEAMAFIKWLGDNHFTFLGCRDYTFDPVAGRHEPLEETGLGVLRDPAARLIRRPDAASDLTPEVIGFLTDPSPLIVTKSNLRSRVHRRAPQDYIGIKRFDAEGRLTGERRFVGLFTSSAYHQLPSEIPMLRRKAQRVIERAGFDPKSHDGKALIHVIETFPRDLLFQISEDELLQQGLGIMHVLERPRVRSFFQADRFDRFVSALTFMPRDRFSGQTRVKIGEILARAFDGEVSLSNPVFDENPVARIHTIVQRRAGAGALPDFEALEAEIEAATFTWSDGLTAAINAHAPGVGLERYAGAFDASYTGANGPDAALDDILRLEALAKSGLHAGAAAFHAYARPGDAPDLIRLRMLHAFGTVELSSILPILENLGLVVMQERAYLVRHPDAAERIGLHGFKTRLARAQTLDLANARARIEAALLAVWKGEAENDGFNRLILLAGLGHKDVSIIRAIARYLRQTGFPFSLGYMEEAMARNAAIAAQIAGLFRNRFDPALNLSAAERDANAETLSTGIDTALNAVASLDDDRILRKLRETVSAMLRTNAYQLDRPALAFKIDATKISAMPLPVPWREIFVCSPRVEGVHLRFGRVARGGLRWSDRREDYRTEVLGLVKAQQVKNAVIVPAGAKGGFYPKQLPEGGGRDAIQAEGVAAYKLFVNALIDVTDTIGAAGAIVPPPQTLRYDVDDPYLVVAADKGTATFSDIANGISAERGFWLDDAFASGGSAGYDHKKMGITARGAWEAVKRHFREMRIDIQSEPFTVIGVGDMSGDVFGNGMLLSRAIKLVAAFDHRDIFIDPDPDPDPERNWAERQRLFDLPRSSWADYDKSLISAGGGVFSRSAKSIPMSQQMKALTGLTADSVTPAELMRALLKSSCDLLWFGGIGTYIKASHQSHADAGDRANDIIRVDGRELRAKVIGEGANLGVTQAGRIEAARAGVRLNTDAIDNSAGVDTSDHEVNLKILFQSLSGEDRLSRELRDGLLETMTDEVAELVLSDNYQQTLALSVAQANAPAEIGAHQRLMHALETKGLLNRTVEALPSDEELRALKHDGKGLTRPELAVLLAYAKIDLDRALQESAVPDDEGFAGNLARYFPAAVQQSFGAAIAAHPLRRELVSTILANDLVNRGGPLFVHGAADATGADLASAARAAAMISAAFRLDALYDVVNALDMRIAPNIQFSIHRDAARLWERQTIWALRNLPQNAPFEDTVARYRDGIEALKGTFSGLVSEVERAEVEARIIALMEAGVPDEIADEAGALPLFASIGDIIALAGVSGAPIDAVAGAYFAAGAALGVDRLRGHAARIQPDGHWEALALSRAGEDLFAVQRLVAGKAVEHLSGQGGISRREGSAAVEHWASGSSAAIGRARALIADLERDGAFSTAKLSLAVAQLRDLAL